MTADRKLSEDAREGDPSEWSSRALTRRLADPHSDPPSCWKCAEYWPCPAERARLALAAEAQP